MVTIIDVIREMNIEPTSDLTWSVGAQVRDLYEAETGSLPMKALRPKTHDGGTHCFAVYPTEWKPLIQRIVSAHTIQASKQTRFDF